MMMNFENINNAEQDELERSERRRQRMREMRRRKKRQMWVRRLFIPCAVLLAVCIVLAGLGIGKLGRKTKANKAGINKAEINKVEMNETGKEKEEIKKEDVKKTGTEKTGKKEEISKKPVYVAGCYVGNGIADSMTAYMTDIEEILKKRTIGGKSSEPPLKAAASGTTAALDSSVVSENVVFIDVAEKRILGQKDAGMRISPASMTKILTILVAAEHLTSLDDTFTMTREITDYSFVNSCSNAGFEVGEQVSIKDLFYGTVLPSGADAALGLAIYTAGSHEEFVRLMNGKLDELGLSETSHFTNCVGLFDEQHYSTVYDIGVMLKAAYDNSFCREVLSGHVYNTAATAEHPEGITLSNLFLRRIEDKDTKGEVLCAKTGYVPQSGSCAASLAVGSDGKEYICVTAHSNSPWRCIYDHVALYQQFLP